MFKTMMTSVLLALAMTATAQGEKTFARGADISWCSEMESQGMKFYNTGGQETEICQLMKQIGMNAIRLRVWVNPENGYGAWCDKADVLAKAKRAKAQGLNLMIDFHYSDYFADPGRQTKPKAWEGLSLDQLKQAVATHTTDVLQALKEEGIEPKWVQVGNETTSGMIWEDGRIDWDQPEEKRWLNYVALSNAGYDAVKQVLPQAYVIVHHDKAPNDNLWYYQAFQKYGGKFDMIGLSHYPDWDNWSQDNTVAAQNLRKLYQQLKKPVMIVETGYSNWDETRAENVMKDLCDKMEQEAGCVGILYWEPEVYGGWEPHLLQDDGTWSTGRTGTLGRKVTSNGAFTPNGQPAPALLAIGDTSAATGQRTEPAYQGTFLTPEEGDTVYLYNVTHKKFMSYGNDWNTHATLDLKGIQFTLLKQERDNDDGKPVYVLRDYHPVKQAWYELFMTGTSDEEGNETVHLYTDRGSQADYYFCMDYATGSDQPMFRLYGAEANPFYGHSANRNSDFYVSLHPTYYDTQHEVLTGTGVVYASNSQIAANDWAWVSRENYWEYEGQVWIYDRAQELLALIQEAKVLGISTEAAQAVYDNLNATYDDLTNAIYDLQLLFSEYYATHVTPQNPIDMTARIQNADFEESLDGWVNEAGVSTFELGNWGDMIDGTCFTGTRYMNIWNGQGISGRIYQQLSGLPNGVYVLTAAAYSSADGGQVFAGDYAKDIVKGNATENAMGQDYTVTCVVTDGTLQLGYQSKHETDFWSTMDHIRLTYFGAGADAYQYWVEQCMADAPTFDDARCTQELKDAYDDALAKLRAATTTEEIMQAVVVYLEALNAVNANINAYARLDAARETALDIIAQANEYYGAQLNDFLMEEVDPMLDEHQSSTEEVDAMTAQLQQLVATVERNLELYAQLAERTELLKNYIEQYGATCAASTKTEADALLEEVAGLGERNPNMTNEELEALLARIDEMIFKLQVPAEEASDSNPISYTFMLVNPGFEEEPGVGWTKEGQISTFGLNDWHIDGEVLSGSHYLNLWDGKPNGRVCQTLTGLPNGLYTITAGCFTNCAESTWLFANNDNVLVTSELDMPGTVYEVNTFVTDGTLTLGIIMHNTEHEAWSVADNFTVTCYGMSSVRQPSGNDFEATAISTVTHENATADGVYDLQGRRLDSQAAAGKGLRIVRREGKVRKIWVK